MINPLLKAKVKLTDKIVEVYLLRSTGDYVNYDDMKTIYKKEELIFL